MAQIDSVVVESLPQVVQFDIAVRLVGTVQDFESPHALHVRLTDPQLAVLGEFDVPIAPRRPAGTHLPGYEINHHLPARIEFEADQHGGYDLAFELDEEPQHRHKTTMSVVPPR